MAIQFIGDQILFKRQFGNVIAFDPDCCCDEGSSGSGSGAGDGIVPYRCCPMEPADDCVECLTITFMGDGVHTTSWDGFEIPLDKFSLFGNVAVEGSKTIDDGLPGYTDGIQEIRISGDCTTDEEHPDGRFILRLDYSPVGGGADCSSGTEVEGELTVLSCDPFHVTGYIQLPCTTTNCALLYDYGACDGGVSTDDFFIFFEITE